MKRITEITKRDVYELFRDGYIEEGFVIEERVAYPYYGRLKEIEFLERLYDLEKWEVKIQGIVMRRKTLFKIQ